MQAYVYVILLDTIDGTHARSCMRNIRVTAHVHASVCSTLSKIERMHTGLRNDMTHARALGNNGRHTRGHARANHNHNAQGRVKQYGSERYLH